MLLSNKALEFTLKIVMFVNLALMFSDSTLVFTLPFELPLDAVLGRLRLTAINLEETR